MNQNTLNAYAGFLQGKTKVAPASGFSISPDELPDSLFDWQRRAVIWALERGCAALFEECGLGKSPQQLAWSQAVVQEAGEVLILAPLAVAHQTAREAVKFGIEVPVGVARDASEVVAGGITIANYERLDKFDVSRFAGVVLDESSILKSFSGSIKQALVQSFQNTPYRLACTATPAPNDHMELGNHAEFLGIMRSAEMLARWFINDTASFGTYRLKRYAEADFWRWVTTWAICLGRPSDLTLDVATDVGYNLPELRERVEVVETDATQGAGDRLFRTGDLSATGMHKDKKLTLVARCEAVARIANETSEAVIVWCEQNEESALLARLIPDAVEVRGSDTPDAKEKKLAAFSDGTVRVIVTKPSICGWGLNWQHCAKVVFCSVTYSFESYYQAVRRSYRFGQTRPVEVVLVAAQTETGILSVLQRKREEHEKMMNRMTIAMREASNGERRILRADAGFTPVQAPAWLSA